MTKVKEEKKGQALAKKDLTQSERFAGMVIAEFGTGVGEVALTNFQRRLVGNYFVACDAAMKAAEKKRLGWKDNPNKLPCTWDNVNLETLARSVMSAARIGLDPAQKNHINIVPFKNNALGKYDMTIIDGYRGKELKAKKYGLDVPDSVTVELVYSNDKFKPVKKDMNHPVETYELEIVNSFDRGEVIGGFYYHAWKGKPEKNILHIFTLKDIEKRKPAKASPEFWGGEKDIWENGKKTGKITVDGWYEEMCWKTIFRAAYENITIDSQKIDDDFLRLQAMENDYRVIAIEEEIKTKANQGEVIDIIEGTATEIKEEAPALPSKAEWPTREEAEKSYSGQNPGQKLLVEEKKGPGF